MIAFYCGINPIRYLIILFLNYSVLWCRANTDKPEIVSNSAAKVAAQLKLFVSDRFKALHWFILAASIFESQPYEFIVKAANLSVTPSYRIRIIGFIPFIF